MTNDKQPARLTEAKLQMERERENDDMTTASLEGQTLGKYRVLEPLGRGGMARVYQAYHPQLDRYVAIKILRSDLLEDEAFLSRFQREARAVAMLRHANVVQVFDFDVQDDLYYMVMELLEGETLKTRLNDYRVRGERMGLGEIVRILLDVLDGLAYAHSEGMIHRDIKPANILLTRRGQAIVADFGIARIVGGTRHTVSGALMGTLDYMAPEQGMRGQSDARSDLYSLGIVLYEMLTQRTPFEADTPLAVLMKHVNDPLPLPRKINPDIPEPFERVVLKMLSKEPEDRYQSAEEAARALRQAAEAVDVELPDRISLPLSFQTSEALSESVAVLSGTARERLPDDQFSQDDTDATLGERLAAERGSGEQEDIKREIRGAMSALGALGQVMVGKAAQGLKDAVEKQKQAMSEDLAQPGKGAEDQSTEDGDEETILAIEETDVEQTLASSEAESVEPTQKTRAKKTKHGPLASSILTALGILLIGNVCMLTVAVPTNAWDLYEIGWPTQLFLFSLGLCVIMYRLSSIWMTIPVITILSVGGALAYTQVTRLWSQWSFLWIFILWAIGASILIPILLRRSNVESKSISRLIALGGGAISVMMISLINVVSMFAAILF